MRDKYTIKGVDLFQAQNGGWIAKSRNDESNGFMREVYGAFTTNEDLMDWLSDNLHDADVLADLEDKQKEPA